MTFSTAEMYSSPNSVRDNGVVFRSKIGVPMRSSAFLMVRLREDWEIYSRSAARLKLFSW